MSISSSVTMSSSISITKKDLLNLEIITECVSKFPYSKKQRISD